MNIRHIIDCSHFSQACPSLQNSCFFYNKTHSIRGLLKHELTACFRVVTSYRTHPTDQISLNKENTTEQQGSCMYIIKIKTLSYIQIITLSMNSLLPPNIREKCSRALRKMNGYTGSTDAVHLTFVTLLGFFFFPSFLFPDPPLRSQATSYICGRTATNKGVSYFIPTDFHMLYYFSFEKETTTCTT